MKNYGITIYDDEGQTHTILTNNFEVVIVTPTGQLSSDVLLEAYGLPDRELEFTVWDEDGFPIVTSRSLPPQEV